MSFQQLCDALVHGGCRTQLSGEDLFFAGADEWRRTTGQALSKAEELLSDNERLFLSRYKSLHPDKSLYDLSQNPSLGRGRTELASGVAMCLATSSSRLWLGAWPLVCTAIVPGMLCGSAFKC